MDLVNAHHEELMASMRRIEAKLDKHLDEDAEIHIDTEHRVTKVEGKVDARTIGGIVVSIILAVLGALGFSQPHHP